MNTTVADIINPITRDRWLNEIMRWPSSSTARTKELLLHCLEMDKRVAELKSQLEKEALINNMLTAKLEARKVTT